MLHRERWHRTYSDTRAALAGIPTLARGRYARVVMAGVGCLLVGFAALNINGALAIVGVRPAATVAAVHEVSENVRPVDGVQVVTMTADERGYTPPPPTSRLECRFVGESATVPPCTARRS